MYEMEGPSQAPRYEPADYSAAMSVVGRHIWRSPALAAGFPASQTFPE
jgi:hypothetical protein